MLRTAALLTFAALAAGCFKTTNAGDRGTETQPAKTTPTDRGTASPRTGQPTDRHTDKGTEVAVGTNGGKDSQGKPKLTVKYMGHTADYWAEKLNDADKDTSRGGALGLEMIGAESAPFVLAALKSNIEHVKLHSFSVLATAKWAKDEQKSLAPALNRCLKDGSAEVRRGASYIIGQVQFPECVTALRQAAAAETDTTAKKAMESDLAKIK